MKKNVMMRLASFLLVAVLISTSAISGTYAKYVTKGSASDSARVAKFGVTVKANFDATFSNGYQTSATNSTDTEANASVWADVDVVAPGTSGELADFEVTGTPEVDVAVSYVADFEIGDNWKVDASNNNVQAADYVRDTFYCPIIVNVTTDSGAKSFSGLTYANAEEFETAVEAEIAKAAATYDAGTSLKTEVENDLLVTWAWAFDSTSANGTGFNNDYYDTQLGDAAVWLTAPTLSLDISCTVTQID